MVLDQARQDIVAILKKAGVHATPADIVFPPSPTMGDLSFPLFAAAKKRGAAPGALAQEIRGKLVPHGLVERIEIAGSYLNFFLDRKKIVAQAFRSDIRAKNLSYASKPLKGQRIMLEMVSPNTNKPLHLGHLRNAFLGESAARLLESRGAKVIRACLFSDRGLHMAKAMLGYKLWGAGKTPRDARVKADAFVVWWYVAFEKKAKGNPNLVSQAEELVRRFEAGEGAAVALWRKMTKWALEGINATMKRFGMKFDALYYESKLWKAGKKVVTDGLKRRVFKKDATGAVMVDFPEDGLPPKVLMRSDGTAIYATADLALGPEKFKKYKLTRSIWCVGQEQDLYFKQLFAIYRRLGFKWADFCEHLTYGLVFLPEGKMKTREGTVVEADPLLNKMIKLVKEEVRVRHTHLTEKEIDDRAEIIAQAALRYYLLKVSPRSAVHFDPKASIAFTGDTGPYLLYTYARMASILRKANGKWGMGNGKKSKPYAISDKLISAMEWSLTMSLARFPEVVAQSARDRDPSHLAQYLYGLAKTFSDFYEAVPVLVSQPKERAARLALVSSIRVVLSRGLHLLSIKPLEEM